MRFAEYAARFGLAAMDILSFRGEKRKRRPQRAP
jgi:hypothetical protein